VLTWDPTGPNACLKLGYQAHKIVIAEQPGSNYVAKFRGVLQGLEARKAQLHQAYGSIVVDCASTAADKLHEDAKRTPKNANNPDIRAPYFELGIWFREFVNRVVDLGLPSVWLAWQTEGGIHEEKNAQGQKVSTMEWGGADVLGRAGRSQFHPREDKDRRRLA
jgi:hypothetical protein